MSESAPSYISCASGNNSFEEVKQLLKSAHLQQKQLFFSLLKPEMLAMMSQNMAGIDKIYGTQEQYNELRSWLIAAGKKDFIKNMYPIKYGPDPRAISIFSKEQDVWLYENCPFEWVRDRIEDQYLELRHD